MEQLLTEDSRLPIEKLRRYHLQKICKENDIKFDPTGPATDLRKLIEGSNVDIYKSNLFEKIQFQDESGRTKETVLPKIIPHATANADIDYDSILEAKAKASQKEEENVKLRSEIDELKAMVAKLLPKEEIIPGKIESDLSLAERYEVKFGKKPHHKMKEETIREKLNAVA